MTRDIFNTLRHHKNIFRMRILKIKPKQNSWFNNVTHTCAGVRCYTTAVKMKSWLPPRSVCSISVYTWFGDEDDMLDWSWHWFMHSFPSVCGICYLLSCFLWETSPGRELGKNDPFLSSTKASVLPNSSLFMSTSPLCLARNTEWYLDSARSLALFFCM